ncbi:kinase-like domain-containing protein [Circinella umbellata]|nr:kinase-like domain-containing protein [Circinella umbellata]
MVTPESTLSSDISCSSSIELIENTDFPYIESGDQMLLRQEPEEIKVHEVKEERQQILKKGFRPFVRANSISSSSGSIATVTMKTIRRMKKKSPLHGLTVHLKSTYKHIDPEFGYTNRSNPCRVLTRPSKPAKNDGYDNEKNDYIIRVHDILRSSNDKSSQYKIIDLLGSGTFGQVVKCVNLSTHELVSVKIIKNKSRYRQQSMLEAEILQRLHQKLPPKDREYILKIHTIFDHKNHLCIVSELLSFSLFELLQQNRKEGLPIHFVRSISIRLIETLVLLKEAKFIHCDLKPENILLKSVDSPEIKVIDYGAACHENKKEFTYIQTRFYRAPEVILGMPYSFPIDMWSAGCVIGEVFLGKPLFNGISEHNQLRRIIDILGSIPPEMLNKGGTNTKKFYLRKTLDINKDNTRPAIFRMKSQEEYSQDHNIPDVPIPSNFPKMGLTDLILNYTNPLLPPHESYDDKRKEIELRQCFADFLKGLLTIDPENRWTPKQARDHPFISGKPLSRPYIPTKEKNTSGSNSSTTAAGNGKSDDGKKSSTTTGTTTSTQNIVTTDYNRNSNLDNSITATVINQQQKQEHSKKENSLSTVMMPAGTNKTSMPDHVPVKGKLLAEVSLSKQQQQKQQHSKSFPTTSGNVQHHHLEPIPYTRSQLFNDHRKAPSQPINGNIINYNNNQNNDSYDGNYNNNNINTSYKQSIIIMPEATVTASNFTTSNTTAAEAANTSSPNNNGNGQSRTTTKDILKILSMTYKQDGSPAGAISLTSSPIVDAAIAKSTITTTAAAATMHTSIIPNTTTATTISPTTIAPAITNSILNKNNSTASIMNYNNKNVNGINNNNSEPDISRRIKIAPLVKLRRGSHDSYRMPDEIHCQYGSSSSSNNEATFTTATTLKNDFFFQHNNSSQVKLNSFDNENNTKTNITNDIISNNTLNRKSSFTRKPSSKHAGEAAGGLLRMGRHKKM